MTRKRLLSMIGFAVLTAVLPVGCGPIKPPRMPQHVTQPTTDVLRVDLIASDAKAAKYKIIVTFVNPNTFALPMPYASYTLDVAGHTYSGDAVPNITIPAQGQINLTLPAVITTPGAVAHPGQSFKLTGTATLQPPGQMRSLAYELGVPMPTLPFGGSGTVTQGKPTAE